MSISVQSNKNVYTGNGSNTTFQYTFKIFQDSDLTVTTETGGVSTSYTLDVDYTVTGAGEATGGNVVFTTAPTDGHSVVIIGTYNYVQDTEYTAGSSFPAASHEAALDKLTTLAIKHKEILDRSLRFGDTYTNGHVKVDAPVENQYLRWGTDSLGNDIIESYPAGSDHGSMIGLSDDDHTQYHTDTRGDARYYTQQQVDARIASASGTTQLILLDDTPSTYDDGKYLKSTASGTEWAAASDEDIVTVSGVLQDQIDTNASNISSNSSEISYIESFLDEISYGVETLSSGISFYNVPVTQSSSNYAPVVSLINDTDLNPTFIKCLIIIRSTSYFQVNFSPAIDSDNYKLSWHLLPIA